MTDETNTGDYNSGDYNTGDHNSGHHSSGNFNSGSYNSGDYNPGHCNSGNSNTGDFNSGHCNSGNYNTGRYHVGCFNTTTAKKAYYFNKLIDKAEWDLAVKPNWIYNVSPTAWVPESSMTNDEKSANPSYKTTGGYLRKTNLKEEWVKAFAAATPKDIERTKALPAFDAEVFLEITGIDLRDKAVDAPCEGREVEIDGVTYVLKLKGETK